MVCLFENVLALADRAEHLNIVLIVGLAIFGGTVGAKLFQKMHVPQVVGYVFIGILIGPMIMKILSADTVQRLEPFNYFALGIIGFMVGGELKKDMFIRFGKQAVSILLFEGVAAFLVVGLLTFGITWYFSNISTAIAVGVVFGGICTATDPASTLQVLWEYKCRGPLSTMLMAIVALDDALALVLYAIAVSIASVFTGMGEASFAVALIHSFLEIVLSLGQGVIAGMILTWILKHNDESEKILVFTISSVMLSIGIAMAFHLDVILASMALGITMINLAPRRTKGAFELVHKFAAPIYVLFFVLVGARLNITNFNRMVAMLAVAYVCGSLLGKTMGSYLGARSSKAGGVIRKYLGFCLYPQGGIAVGLLIAASHRFDSEIGQIIVMVVVTGVFTLQIIGPICTKFGMRKAREINMNITEEDLIKSYNVSDLAETDVAVIDSNMSITKILEILGDTDLFYYPVVDKAKKLIGAITMDGVRNTFTTTEMHEWLIALDIMEPIIAKTTGDVPLSKALRETKNLQLEYLPIVENGDTLKGVLDARGVSRKLSTIILEKQKEVDELQSQM